MNCNKCHWYVSRNPHQKMRCKDGIARMFPCNNIPSDGWEYWYKHQSEPQHCKGYIPTDDFEPDPYMVEIVEAVAKEMEREKTAYMVEVKQNGNG